MFCVLKKKKCILLDKWKTSYSFNNFKCWRIALYCSKTLSVLLRGITSTNDGDLCYFNYLHSFRTKTKLESHQTLCENKVFVKLLYLWKAQRY